MAITVLLFPNYVLYPFLGSEDMSLFVDTQPIFYILFVILTLFAIGGFYFNGMVGTGATLAGLRIQAICAAFYILLIYVFVNHLKVGLVTAWTLEVFYWVPMILMVHYYMIGEKWKQLRM